MPNVPSCTQYQTSACDPSITVNPNLATLFGVAPTSGIFSDGQCPSGQTMYIARQPQTGPNQFRPYFYACAATMDEAKTMIQNQQPNQTIPLSQSNSECFVHNGGDMHTSCTYSTPGPNSIDAKVIRF